LWTFSKRSKITFRRFERKRVIQLIPLSYPLLGPLRLTMHPVEFLTTESRAASLPPRKLGNVRNGFFFFVLFHADVLSDLPRQNFPKITRFDGWLSACSPTSPAIAITINLDQPPPADTGKRFIYDHRKATDPCLHPGHFWRNGNLVAHNQGPWPQHDMVPEFASSSTSLHHNIMFPSTYGWIEDILPRAEDPEWSDRLDERLSWRGGPTGIYNGEGMHWEIAHRATAVRFANDLKGTIDVLIPTENATVPVGRPKSLRKAHLNPAMMDIAFAGDAMQCSPPVCQQLENNYRFVKYQGQKEAGRYKYVLDVRIL
jgi:hypothetical protein